VRLGSDCYWRSSPFLRSLEKSTLNRVFLEWMRTIEGCIETSGNYVWYAKINIVVLIGFKQWASRRSMVVKHAIHAHDSDSARSSRHLPTVGMLPNRGLPGHYRKIIQLILQFGTVPQSDCLRTDLPLILLVRCSLSQTIRVFQNGSLFVYHSTHRQLLYPPVIPLRPFALLVAAISISIHDYSSIKALCLCPC
jgi:hypothetical protein